MIKEPKIFGVLNCTPDSFFDGGNYFDPSLAIDHGKKLIDAGVSIIDIGGESTRPYSEPVSAAEEMRRVLPVIQALKGLIPFSIDTTKPEVAKMALTEGVDILNDVSGFRDPEMIAVAKAKGCTVVVMHMLGSPKTMQMSPHYPNGVVEELLDWFQKKVDTLTSNGIDSKKIILDPGIGFGKTKDDNIAIIRNIPRFKQLGFPLLIGLSRKAFMTKILQKPPTALLPTTIALNTMSLLLGADMIRVHDVQEHRDVIEVLKHFHHGMDPLAISPP